MKKIHKRKSFTQYTEKNIKIIFQIKDNGSFAVKSQFYLKNHWEYYKLNRIAFQEAQKKWKHKNRLKIIEYLGGKCQHCGLISSHPEIYDVHHINPTDKKHLTYTTQSFKNIKNELDKCILLCSNCHRIVHNKFTI